MMARRGLLAGLAGLALGGWGAGGALWAQGLKAGPLPRPRPRPAALPAAGTKGGTSEAALWQGANLSGDFAYILADLASGLVLAERGADMPLPPASVAKAVTTLFALDRLGPDHRFATRLLSNGKLDAKGQLQGDLYLVGGGDPNFDSDQLADLVAALAETGIRGLTGRLIICDGALPYHRQITQAQPEHLGYNPAISGLNLNYNRVNCEWRAVNGSFDLSMDARGERVLPRVHGIRASLAAQEAPILTWSEDTDGAEHWQLARAALQGDGSRWLPVRRPAPYVAEVFATLALAHGLRLPAPGFAPAPPPEASQLLADHFSDPLSDVLRKMLKFSTNLTAEVVGLTASGAGTIAGSAAIMSDWATQALGLGASRFHDHSGLGPESRSTARDLATVFVNAARAGHGAALQGLVREAGLADAKGREVKDAPTRIRAKSGTMNFVSNLAGVIDRPGAPDLAFALLCADPGRRDLVPLADREEPKGAPGWTKRARRLHQGILRLWAKA